MTIDTKELRRLAQAATPGSWYVEHGNYVYGCKDVIDGEEEWHPIIACTDDGEPGNFAGNAAFVAAANPAAVAELLDRLEAAEKERDALRAKVEQMERQEPIGTAHAMPGAGAFTMACFDAQDIPVGAMLYALPGAQTQGKETEAKP